MLLSLTPTEDVKRSYRALALQYHPDKVSRLELAGMGIVHGNANFCCSETDFLQREKKKKKIVRRKKNQWCQKKEAPVLHQKTHKRY